MNKITIYGASDDLVEVGREYNSDNGEEGEKWEEEFDGDDVAFNIGGHMIVRMRYNAYRNGCWTAEIGQLAECLNLRDIAVTQHERGYSALVTFEVPGERVSITRMYVGD